MKTRISALLSALLLGPMILTGGAAAADAAKLRPNLRALPKAKTECPSQPGGVADPTEGRVLRPQPEPPGRKAKLHRLRPGARGLRPQPEPPGKQGKQGSTLSVLPGAKRGFNPQPEPPKALSDKTASPC